MKKSFCIFALCFSLILGSSTVFASPEDVQAFTKDELNNELKQLGFPDKFVSEMSLEQKQDIIGKNPVGL